MHPALSIVLFTALAGAGYGLLFVLALAALLDLLPSDRWLGGLGLGLALALTTTGLLFSTAHLKHPERAWRAFSQWRSSWLSREAVAALLTNPPALLLGWAWAGRGEFWPVAALFAALGAAATVYCTAMIYASLKPVARWRHPLTAPCYLALALCSGGMAAAALVRLRDQAPVWLDLLAGAALLLAWALKLLWWRRTDSAALPASPGSATGLGRFGEVRLLDPPHSQANYLLREMGFQIARRHARKLRRIACGAGGVAPALLLVVAMRLGQGPLAAAVLAIGFVVCLCGIVIERWLFFAEARHTVMLYYGAQSV